MERRDPLHHDHRSALKRLAPAALVALALALAGVGIVVLAGLEPGPGAGDPSRGPPKAPGRGGPDRPAAPGGPGGGPGLAAEEKSDDEIPADLRAALRGGPVPFEGGGAGAPPAGGAPGGAAGGGAGEAGAPAGGGGGPAEAGAGRGGEAAGGGGAGGTELARRAEWIKRQERRNDLRVEVMKAELGIAPESAKRVRDAFTAFVSGKVALYETLDAEGMDKARLTSGIAGAKADLERRLVAELGQKSYDAYVAMEKAGKFVLPEEKKKP